MDAVIRPSVLLFDQNTRFLPQALQDVRPEDLCRSCGEQSNPLIWVAGHLVWSRNAFANLLGLRRTVPWPELFSRGTPRPQPDLYPALEAILEAWQEVSSALRDHLESLDDSQLSRACPRPLPIEDPTLRGAVAFMAYHEAYHLGQIGYLRKWLGYGQMVG